MKNAQEEIPASVVTRLTRYLTKVQSLRTHDVQWVSSQELADELGLTSSTVRQDLSHIDFSGISRRGYETAGLEKALTDVLGIDSGWNAVVIGAGNLGRALALHEEFPRRGFTICGVFDNDPEKIGQKLGDFTIRSIDEIPRFVRAAGIDIGIIAVPEAAAQTVADLLIASRIKGLLNLSLSHISAPRRVPVKDARVVARLLELAHSIKYRS